MVVAFLRPSCWAALPLALLAVAALLGVGTAQPSVAQRTHTFQTYQQISEVKGLLPVFVSTVKLFQGTYAQDKIVNLTSGVELNCMPYAADGLTNCTLIEAWRKPRRAPESKYTPITLNSGCPIFAMKYDNKLLRLMVSPQCIAQGVYTNFGAARTRRQLAWGGGGRGNKTNYAAKAAAKWASKDDDVMDPSIMGLYYDPWEPDGFTPYWPGTTAADIRREKKEAEKARRRFARLHRKEQKDFAQYDRWVRKQLKIKKGQPMNLTPEQYDKYYRNPDPFTNKHYPWRWTFDHSGVNVPQAPGMAGMSAQSAGGDSFKALNEVDTSFIFDYALVFDTTSGPVRIDMTIIPKVFRNGAEPPPSAFLCRPDGQESVFPMSPAIKDYVPQMGSCAAGNRSAPYARIDPAYDQAHPEEKAWLDGRLAVTGPKVRKFVNDQINQDLTPEQAKLKIAVVHSGGGKRAMLQSLGVVQGLTDLGVFEHASWNAGASGGAWYVLAHTLASLGNTTGMNDAASVYGDLKSRITSSLYGDYFEANEIFTDAGATNAAVGGFIAGTGTPLVYPSRIPAPQTSQILCESELKLQSPLIPSGRSASPLDYWARAMTAQDVPSSQLANRGLDITLSSLVNSQLLQNHAGPLPMFQIHEFANSDNQGAFRLWTVSPYDFSLMNGNQHATFPTAILGSDSTSSGDTCTVNLDNAGYLQGISSWAMGAFRGLTLLPDAFIQAVCGNNIEATACQGTALPNPFKGFGAVDGIAPGLSQQDEIFVSDGGTEANMPIWPFLSETRKADIIFAVDSGGVTAAKGTPSLSNDPTLSIDTKPTNPGTCPSDLGQSICQVNSNADSPTSKTDGTSCCNMCLSGYSVALGCFSDNSPRNSNLRVSYDKYSNNIPNNKAPDLPLTDIRGVINMGQQVVIFGCDTVATLTPIINFPNRIINSGHSGHYTLKGAINMRYTPFPIGENAEQQYTPAAVEAFWQNAKAGIPNLQSGDGSFSYCIACLYYAKAKQLNSYMKNSCNTCYKKYCYEGLNALF